MSPSNNTDFAATQPGSELQLPEQLGRNTMIKRDQAIFWEGDAATSFYRVVSGAVRICKLMADGRRQVTDFFTAGDLIVLDLADKYSFTAEAVVDCIVRQYPRTAIFNLVKNDQRFSQQLLAITCSRLMSAHHQMMTLGRKTAEERMATFLTGLVQREPRRSRQIELPMSRTDIADYLGLTVETVSRVLSRLKQQGVISVPNTHSVSITDPEALELLCDGAA
jgi:CRP/FNR family transcriptional regulator